MVRCLLATGGASPFGPIVRPNVGRAATLPAISSGVDQWRGPGKPAGYAESSTTNVRPLADDTDAPGDDHWPHGHLRLRDRRSRVGRLRAHGRRPQRRAPRRRRAARPQHRRWGPPGRHDARRWRSRSGSFPPGGRSQVDGRTARPTPGRDREYRPVRHGRPRPVPSALRASSASSRPGTGTSATAGGCTRPPCALAATASRSSRSMTRGADGGRGTLARGKSRHPSRIHEDRTTVVVAGSGLGGVAAAHGAAERGADLGLAGRLGVLRDGPARSRPSAARSARCSRATRPCARRSTGHARRPGGQRPADAPAAEARATRRAAPRLASRIRQ